MYAFLGNKSFTMCMKRLNLNFDVYIIYIYIIVSEHYYQKNNLDPTCNKYRDLIGRTRVSIPHKKKKKNL